MDLASTVFNGLKPNIAMNPASLAAVYGAIQTPSPSACSVLPKELTSSTLRRGKWTVEEERYTEKIIMDFENGTLDVPEGTTLRCYLSKVLNCDPMRITKKYTGNSSIGKRTFTPLVPSPENVSFIDMSRKDLDNLRRIWVNKLLIAEQWNQKKLQYMKKMSVSDGDMFAANEEGILGMLPEQYMALNGGYLNPYALDALALHDEKIISALRPYVSDPAEMQYLLNWLKTSNYALSNPASIPELDHLIHAGDSSVNVLYNALSSGAANQSSQMDQLQKVIESYFDYRRMPTDVINRVYQTQNPMLGLNEQRMYEHSDDSDVQESENGGKQSASDGSALDNTTSSESSSSNQDIAQILRNKEEYKSFEPYYFYSYPMPGTSSAIAGEHVHPFAASGPGASSSSKTSLPSLYLNSTVPLPSFHNSKFFNQSLNAHMSGYKHEMENGGSFLDNQLLQNHQQLYLQGLYQGSQPPMHKEAQVLTKIANSTIQEKEALGVKKQQQQQQQQQSQDKKSKTQNKKSKEIVVKDSDGNSGPVFLETKIKSNKSSSNLESIITSYDGSDLRKSKKQSLKKRSPEIGEENGKTVKKSKKTAQVSSTFDDMQGVESIESAAEALLGLFSR